MFSPFTADTAPAPAPVSKVRPAESTAPKVTFRPPVLAPTATVVEPFVRVGPRLRSREVFSRPLAS